MEDEKMGTYRVWVAGADQFGIIEPYDEDNDVPGAFPGLTHDYICNIEEPGPASLFASASDEELPFAIVHGAGQIVRESHPGSTPDPSVKVGVGKMRTFLDSNPDEIITPMTWHS